MINFESKEISKRSITDVFNKKNKSWIATSIKAKPNMNHSKHSLTLIQLNMKQLLKKRCWWSLKRIDLLLKLRVLRPIWDKLKETMMIWLVVILLTIVKLILVQLKHKVLNSQQVEKVQQNNRQLASKWEEQNQVLENPALLLKRNLVQFKRLIHQIHITMMTMSLATLQWVVQKFSKVILWEWPV